jgi:hypothetical protein
MARPDENPIKAARNLSEDFQNAAVPAREQREVDEHELEYRPPEPSSPGLGSGVSPQPDKPHPKSKSIQRHARVGWNEKSVALSPSVDQARSMIRRAFNRDARARSNEIER